MAFAYDRKSLKKILPNSQRCTCVMICLKDATPLRVKTLTHTNLVESRHIKREKSSLPVDVRLSKTLLLKPPIKAQGCNVAFMEIVIRSLVSVRLSVREAQARIPFVAHGT